MRRRIITLTTDFGLSDPFVGIMKGVILGIHPDALIVDLCHEVPPQNVLHGALMVATAAQSLPPDTIHVAVVDPGVGSRRAAIAVETSHGTFIGPDNGLFTEVVRGEPTARSVELDNPAYHRQPVSDTFHGRDIFAPVAAHLAAGVPFENLGTPMHSLVTLAISEPYATHDGLELHVLLVDRFGNLVTDLTREAFQEWEARHHGARPRFEVRGVEIQGVHRTYADVEPGEFLAYFGSGGRLEIAVREGSVFAELRAMVGDVIAMHAR